MEQIILILKQHLVLTEMVAEAKILVQKHSTNVLFNFHLLNVTIYHVITLRATIITVVCDQHYNCDQYHFVKS